MSTIPALTGVHTPVADLVASNWAQLAASVSHADFELDAEAFSVLFAAYTRRKRAGLISDPMLIAIFGCLARQAYATDDGMDGLEDLETHVSPA